MSVLIGIAGQHDLAILDHELCAVFRAIGTVEAKAGPQILLQEAACADQGNCFLAVFGLDILECAQNFQQFAFYYSTSGKIAFITAFYMFFVPLFSVLFFKKKIAVLTWASIIMGIAGLFLLCIDPSDLTSVNLGDALALICAVFYAVQIMLIDKFLEENVNGVQLSFMQFTVAAVISIVAMFIFEKPVLADIKTAAPSLLYSGIMSCGIAYTLQIVGQKHASPVVASLLMCLESVFAVIAAAIILKEGLLPRELAGCIVMFSAIILSQVSETLSAKKRNQESAKLS
jgi:drug/metabolite transporter (DMT)-like permease